MMSESFNPSRRRFVGACASVALLTGGGLPRLVGAARQPLSSYPRVKLVHLDGRTLKVDGLRRGESYVFTYPYVCTPCFLLDLGRELEPENGLETREGETYAWRGGVGPNGSVVAFSAICSHRMSHPAPGVSFISYRPGEQPADSRGAGVIHCCSEGSVFDPAAGGRVLAGPAPEPLAAIALDYDPATGAVYAEGAYGGTLFPRFLAAFGDRLALDYGPDRFDRPVRTETPVVTLEEFSHIQMSC